MKAERSFSPRWHRPGNLIRSYAKVASAESNLHGKVISPPVIDIGLLVDESKRWKDESKKARADIVKACEEWGFFLIANHGVVPSLEKNLQSQMRLFFFDSDPSIRNSVRRTATNSRGFADDELTKQKRDAKLIYDIGEDHPSANGSLDGSNQWPDESHLPGFRPAVSAYFDAMTNLSKILLDVIADPLGPNAKTEIRKSFTRHTSFLRLNTYPPIPPDVAAKGVRNEEGGQLGISRHTDAGALTIIMQDGNAALEVYSGSKQDIGDGQWVPIDPAPGTFVVNTGDMMQVWSNNRFKAPEHRVRAQTSARRLSAPYFYNPSYESTIRPLTDESEPPKYRGFTWGEFRSKRFAGDFSDYGKEIQIEDYLV